MKRRSFSFSGALLKVNAEKEKKKNSGLKRFFSDGQTPLPVWRGGLSSSSCGVGTVKMETLTSGEGRPDTPLTHGAC